MGNKLVDEALSRNHSLKLWPDKNVVVSFIHVRPKQFFLSLLRLKELKIQPSDAILYNLSFE